MIILGIDPGVATIGFGLVRAERNRNQLLRYGVITTPPGIPLSNRLLQISNDMEELIHAFHPDEMAVEELFFTKNITTGIAVAHGRGVILLAAEKLGVPVFEYTPMQVKQAVVGYGKAEKRQVMLMTQRLLHMKEIPRPDDAADALALAICHSRAATSLLNTDREFDPAKYDTR
ncbi:crossover junction endodeoxyribonuclease RuvC [Colidextribacter sp. 210702-DFI.3.9]|uniref:Crossover junction endodeoxyribonuclease RuvC n=1 Tax=Flintibacter faecis TaxID=2763047 RepID=A0A8J6J3Y0_9FIRM|nr:crossover junction endodeoxyribonuclease RuvC [Flintibacter faecis]MBC5717170.1 crossover junction endodeoxyribonuclease RuvC [Flintibacter faecis]MCB6501477.1 crossover junction endodeoxyribonuclease RuvC [Colidextribacter sp. 210702-DFI.3.9]MCG4468516.1 crossover junction endodeoxyribonuclease RuvC [Lawsonibacter sp. DFI.6.74]MCG4774307.1 crossover junction endodeoxyribonuclease RuvC [Lawsonibacter sp. DFI.5.51]